MERLVRLRSKELVAVVVLAFLVLGAYGVAESDILASGNPTGELIGQYRMDEGAGITVHDAATDDDGETRNNISWVDGKFGKAMHFHSTINDRAYVKVASDGSVGDYSFTNTTNFTLSAWIKPVDGGTNKSTYYVGRGHTAHSYGLSYDPAGPSIGAHVRDGSGSADVSTNIQMNEWYHTVMVHEAHNRLALYINGEQVAVDTTNIQNINNFSSTHTKFIGGSGRPSGTNSHSSGFREVVDDVRVYSTALTEDEIKSLYNHGSSVRIGTEPKDTGGKVLDVSFDRWNSTHVFDTSGAENHGRAQDGAEQKSIAFCKTGRCYELDGDNDNVKIPHDPSLSMSDELTVMGWFKTRSYQPRQEILRKDGEYSLQIDDGGSAGFVDFDVNASDWTWKEGSYNISLDTWTHLALSWNGTHQQLYADGVLQDTAAESGTIEPTSNPVWIAEKYNAFDGTVDQAKIFDRALSQQEIIEEAGIERSGAVLDLRFDERAGATAYDNSVHGNNGVLKPGETAGPQWTDGVQGNALAFDGDDDYINLSATPDLKTSMVSVNFWFKTRESRNYRRFAENGDAGANIGWAVMFTDTAGELRADVNTENGGAVYLRSDKGWNDGTWHMLSLTYNGSQAAMYVDGKLEASGAISGDINYTDNEFWIGADPGVSNWINATIDNFRVYPYGISQDRINTLYRRGSGRIGEKTGGSKSQQAPAKTSRIADWSFDRGNSTHTFDSSGEVNHAKPDNGPEQTDAANCKVGRCYSFDGVDDNIDVPHGTDGEFDMHEGAVSWWMKPKRSGRYHQILQFREQGVQDYLLIRWNDTHEESISLFGETGDTLRTWARTDPGVVPAGTWTHVVVQQNGTHHQMYVNGEKQSVSYESSYTNKTFWFTHTFPASYDFEIGDTGSWADNGEDVYFNGTLDEFQIYNRSLTQDEIWYLYSSGRDRGGSGAMAGPAAWWRFDTEPNAASQVKRSNQYWTTGFMPDLNGRALWSDLIQDRESSTTVTVEAANDGFGRWTANVSLYNHSVSTLSWSQINITVNNGAVEALVPADIDHDGQFEVVYGDHTGDDIKYLDNTGSGWQSNTIGSSSGGETYAVGDVDGDGDLDVVAGKSDIDFWENDNGDASSWTNHDAAGSNPSMRSLALGDVDGDGDLDVLEVGYSNDVTWWENDGTDSGWSSTDLPSTMNNRGNTIAVGDIDGDGDIDAVAGDQDGQVVWQENDGTSNPSFTEHNITESGSNAYSLALTDIDDDGTLDVFVGRANSDINLYRNTAGDGTSWTSSTIGSLPADQVRTVQTGDLDFDGDLDLAVSADAGSNVDPHWFENNGSYSNWPGNVLGDSGDAGHYGLAIADFDGTGDLDVMTGEDASSAEIRLWNTSGVAVDHIGSDTVTFTDASGSARNATIRWTPTTDTYNLTIRINPARSHTEVLETNDEMAGSANNMLVDSVVLQHSGGNAYDYSGEDNSGTLGANTTSGNDDPNWTGECKRNGCLKFDGNNDLVNVTHSAELDNTETVTMTAWVKSDGTYPNNGRIIAKGGEPETYAIHLEESDKTILFAREENSGADHAINSNTTMDQGEWHHVGATDNGTRMQLYIDGVLEAELDSSGFQGGSTTDPIGIGCSTVYSGQCFSGYLDDVRIYPYALSQVQVKEVMRQGSASFG